MITSKQRAYLKSLANNLDPVFQIGKAGITPDLTEAISEALEARELIKINILKNNLDDPNEIAETLRGRTKSIIVQLIGRKLILYRESKSKKTIELPK